MACTDSEWGLALCSYTGIIIFTEQQQVILHNSIGGGSIQPSQTILSGYSCCICMLVFTHDSGLGKTHGKASLHTLLMNGGLDNYNCLFRLSASCWNLQYVFSYLGWSIYSSSGLICHIWYNCCEHPF